ncbi:ABC transporter permease [Cylindrospermopsis raciborskii CHAB3438]|jgi:ABC-2 type transport system permease protein|uniref:ABC transporter permease n=1 Tax=Cylindrospermopsis raciborskii TaxID=77022 RepID=UPI000E1F82E2|nr:ABC transporter permease [Cylindrospermopsis raciborskii]MCH4902830.1 ABC transporter permease [Cylindrospermopsis raciborskii CHAB3438]MEB3147213.1 ABC transporter permease [Cylindrospermopsis raciborskii]UJL34238.1 ABC transporter permease [Cylindrospermopsis raciborskii Cr2010]UJS03765.1 ABC transporter permease [Cylindrospermopsis raciborskii KLL07]
MKTDINLPSVTSPSLMVSETGSSFIGEITQETLALTRRLFIQLQRRPSTLIAGIIQPVMWLVLFGALFQNAPQGLFGSTANYGQFLAAGVIVFTAFAGALNAGLPVMFDREFGFLNRLLVAPLASRFSIVFASAIFIISQSLLQAAVIVGAAAMLGAGLPDINGLVAIALIVFLLALGVTAISLGLAFALPGHIELIAVIFVSNLPLLFASTALAPLSFMPEWLKIVVALNPLSYAIEPIRHLYLNSDWELNDVVMEVFWGNVSFGGSLLVLLGFAIVALLSIQSQLRKTLA